MKNLIKSAWLVLALMALLALARSAQAQNATYLIRVTSGPYGVANITGVVNETISFFGNLNYSGSFITDGGGNAIVSLPAPVLVGSANYSIAITTPQSEYFISPPSQSGSFGLNISGDTIPAQFQVAVGPLFGAVVNGSGSPLSGITVSAQNAGGGPAITDAGGNFFIANAITGNGVNLSKPGSGLQFSGNVPGYPGVPLTIQVQPPVIGSINNVTI